MIGPNGPIMHTLPVDPQLYLAYLGTMLVMAFTPGPANVFAVATGMQRGKAAALMAVAGMNTATFVWYCAAALGLGALVKTFPEVFRIISYGGILYVVWMAISAIRGAMKAADKALDTPVLDKARNAYLSGFMVQIANPKAILFFTAVLPPFLDIDRPPVPQLALFAVATLGLDTISMSAYGLGGAAFARHMSSVRFQRLFGIGVGVLLLTAAILMAMRL